MNKKVVLLTGGELRHEFFRKFISNQKGIEVLSSYCEDKKGALVKIINKEESSNDLRMKHLSVRESTEVDFFDLFCSHTEDKSNPIFIKKDDINTSKNVNNIIQLNPDIIISFGCSIIKSKLLETFNGRFMNIHLGLSPYYRGSGTNFWPFVNDELQFIGTTFMHIDEGIDTGKIIHQIRAKINFNDNIHQIGNRLIKDSFTECAKLIRNFDVLNDMPQITSDKHNEKYYRKKDFTEDHLKTAYDNILKYSIENYLKHKLSVDKEFPIIKNLSI